VSRFPYTPRPCGVVECSFPDGQPRGEVVSFSGYDPANGRNSNVSSSKKRGVSRRDLLKVSGTAAAAGVLAGVAIPNVHAAGDDTIQVALVGCGGRGNGAAENALLSKQGPVKLVALADVFQTRLD